MTKQDYIKMTNLAFKYTKGCYDKDFNDTYDAFVAGFKQAYKMQQRQLLIDFFMHFRDNGEQNIGMTIEQFVDDFLKTK